MRDLQQRAVNTVIDPITVLRLLRLLRLARPESRTHALAIPFFFVRAYAFIVRRSFSNFQERRTACLSGISDVRMTPARRPRR